MNNLISLIVPIYNSERYIIRFFKNLSIQEFKNIDLVIVDDGSTDNSAKLIKNKIAETNFSIQFIRTRHGGVSSARNAGLSVAKGNIIGFCDIDDVMNKSLLSVIDKIFIQYDCDIAYTYAKSITDKQIKNFEIKNVENENIESVTATSFLNDLSFNEKVYGSVWNKFFKKEIVRKYRFDEHLTLCEDFNFIYKLVIDSSCLKIVKDPVEMYGYVNNITSATHDIRRLYNANNEIKYNEAIYPLIQDDRVSKSQKRKLLGKIFELNSDALFGKNYQTIEQKKKLIKHCKYNYIDYVFYSKYKIMHKLKKEIMFLPYMIKDN